MKYEQALDYIIYMSKFTIEIFIYLTSFLDILRQFNYLCDGTLIFDLNLSQDIINFKAISFN